MKKMSRNKSLKIKHSIAYVAAISATLYTPFFANAGSVTEECNFVGTTFTAGGSTMPACPTGVVGSGVQTTTNALRGGPTGSGYYAGIRISGNPATTLPIYTIDASSVATCRWITYGGGSPFFVPLGTKNEFTTFLTHGPTNISGISFQTCALANNAFSGAPTTTSVGLASNQLSSGCSTSSFTYNTPNVYGRTGISTWPSTPDTQTYTCHSGATTMHSNMQWTAGNVDSSGPNTLGWTPVAGFSPDMTLTSSSGTAYQPGYSGDGLPATVTLYWNIVPAGGNAVTCSTSGWSGPDINGYPRSGSTTVSLYGYSTYSLTCQESPTLVSSTSTSVAFVAAPPPPPPPCCYGDGGGYYGDGGG